VLQGYAPWSGLSLVQKGLMMKPEGPCGFICIILDLDYANGTRVVDAARWVSLGSRFQERVGSGGVSI